MVKKSLVLAATIFFATACKELPIDSSFINNENGSQPEFAAKLSDNLKLSRWSSHNLFADSAPFNGSLDLDRSSFNSNQFKGPAHLELRAIYNSELIVGFDFDADIVIDVAAQKIYVSNRVCHEIAGAKYSGCPGFLENGTHDLLGLAYDDGKFKFSWRDNLGISTEYKFELE